MSVGHVALNGTPFAIIPFEDGAWIRRETVPVFAPVVSPGGQQRQERLTSYSSKVFSSFQSGFGRERILAADSDSAQEYTFFRDSTCDTRWRQITLPVLQTGTTYTGLERSGPSAHFGGDFWMLWTDDSGTDVVARKLDGTVWTGGGNVAALSVGNEPLDLIVHKGKMIALLAQGTSHYTRYSADGASWSTPSTEITSGLLTNNVGANDFDFDGLLAQVGTELVAAVYHEDNGTVTFFSSTDAGDNWADESIEIPSSRGATGLAVYPDIDGLDKLYVGTPEGIWMVDVSPSTWTSELILPMASDNGNCQRMTVHNGALWFPYGNAGGTRPVEIHTMTVEGDSRVFTKGLGLNIGDGPPADLVGMVRWMRSAGEHLYIAIGGAGSTQKGRILCQNGKGWHSVRQNSTANRPMDWLDFNGGNIYYSIRDGIGDDPSNVYVLNNALADPQAGATVNYESTGYIDIPYIDGGMPTVDAAWLRVAVDSGSLSSSTSGEYINIDYGVNGAARSTDLGNITSGTLALSLASGAGVSGRNLGIRVNLHRDGGDTTQTPQLRSVEIDYLKQPEVLDRYTFQVDLQGTVNLGEDSSQGNIEGVITDLETARDLATLPTFMYGNLNGGTNVYVKVRDISWNEIIEVDGGGPPTAPDFDAQRTGVAVVMVERVVR